MADIWVERVPCENNCGKRAKHLFLVVEPGTRHLHNNSPSPGIEVDACVARCARELFDGTTNRRPTSRLTITTIGPARTT